MPGFIARKLCPDLVILPPNFDTYAAVSERIRRIFVRYDPDFCPMSLDEAYLDMTEHLKKRAASTPVDRTFLGYQSPQLICRCPAEGWNERLLYTCKFIIDMNLY